MKKINILAILTLLVSCSSTGLDYNRIAPGYSQAFNAIKAALFGNDINNISNEVIDEIPYASMLVKIGKGPYGLMILQSIEGDRSTWVSGDGVYLVLKKGKIIKTAGLINNLTDLQANHLFNSDKYPSSVSGDTLKYYYSFDSPVLIDLEVEATYEKKEIKNENLVNRSLDLSILEETIHSKQINWKATNKYWTDQENFIWKSEQQISPKVPKIFIQITKKPS